MTEIITRSEFARRCGVTPGAITLAAKKSLKDAAVDDRIDAEHPDAIEYARKKNRGATPPASGVDPLYEEAVSLCRQSGRCSIKFLIDSLRVGHPRARRIYLLMQTTGVAGEITGGASAPTSPAPAPAAPKAPAVTGRAAARQTDMDADVGEPEPIPENILEYADLTLREVIAKYGSARRFKDFLDSVQKIEAIEEKRIKNAAAVGELIHRDLVRLGVIEPLDAGFQRILTDGAKTIAKRAKTLADSGQDEAEIEALVIDLLESHIRPLKSRIARSVSDA